MAVAAHDFGDTQIAILLKPDEVELVYHREPRSCDAPSNEAAAKLVIFNLLIFICSTIADVITSAVVDATGTKVTIDSIISLQLK